MDFYDLHGMTDPELQSTIDEPIRRQFERQIMMHHTRPRCSIGEAAEDAHLRNIGGLVEHKLGVIPPQSEGA